MTRDHRHQGKTTFPQSEAAAISPKQQRMRAIWVRGVAIVMTYGTIEDASAGQEVITWRHDCFEIRMWKTPRTTSLAIWVEFAAAVIFSVLPPPEGFEPSRAKKLPSRGLPVAEMSWSGDEDVRAQVFTAGPWENWFLMIAPASNSPVDRPCSGAPAEATVARGGLTAVPGLASERHDRG